MARTCRECKNKLMVTAPFHTKWMWCCAKCGYSEVEYRKEKTVEKSKRYLKE